MRFAISEPARPIVPVHGSDAVFPVRRIWCVARNYAAHAREMGSDPNREAPFFFSKPGDAVVPNGDDVSYPPATAELHHEVELVLALGKGGSCLTPEQTQDLVYGCAVGVDLTRRDLQAAAKSAGHPWDMAKGFDQSAPIGAILPLEGTPPPVAGRLSLSVNNTLRQNGDLSDMIWKPLELLANLSQFVALAPGDLIFTGTPEGVGPLGRGDRIEASVVGLPPLAFTLR